MLILYCDSTTGRPMTIHTGIVTIMKASLISAIET